MNEIVLVIAPAEFGVGPCDGLEPIIDGVSLVDIMKQADGEIWHAGITGIERALAAVRASPTGSAGTTVQVLGCGCREDGCSGVSVTITATGEAVTWSQIRASTTPGGPPGARTYGDIGPFVFAPDRYAQAVANPVHADSPVREAPDVAALAAGIPRDHAAWLRAMTMAFRRDFLAPSKPELPRNVAARGLRAFADAGTPMGEDAVRTWARGRRLTDDAVERYVAWFNDLNALPPSD